MKIFLKTEDEIELMRKANHLVGETLAELAKHIKPGVTTLQLDRIAEDEEITVVSIGSSSFFPSFSAFSIISLQ